LVFLQSFLVFNLLALAVGAPLGIGPELEVVRKARCLDALGIAALAALFLVVVKLFLVHARARLFRSRRGDGSGCA